MIPETVCVECCKPSRQCCSACKLVHYCSKECQKKHWNVHKEQCKYFSLETHPQYGRYLVATRDIKAGELFLKESPLIIGPKQLTLPLCLGCHKKVDGTYKCAKCKYPLCAKSCEVSKGHKAECLTFQKGEKLINIDNYQERNAAYECVTPIRVLLLKQQDPQKWEQVIKLQSHMEDIISTEIYQRNQKNIVDYAQSVLGWEELEAKELHKICAILIINAFEMQQGTIKIRGLFHFSSFLAHDCKPNTKHAFDEDFNILWRTTRHVSKGESLTNTYTQTLWNTLQRRIHLKTSKFFLCECSRCADPTELDTNFSTLLCNDCGCQVLSNDPLIMDSPWKCIGCGHVISYKQVNWGDQALYQELQNMGKNTPDKLETFLQRYAKALHSKHRFFIETKYALIRYYGNYPGSAYKDLSREQLENKVKWSRELLELADVIDPGLSLLRGNILMELQAGLVGLAKHLLSNDLITDEEANKYMTEAVKHLQDASEILRHEPHMANGGLDDRLSWLSKELEI